MNHSLSFWERSTFSPASAESTGGGSSGFAIRSSFQYTGRDDKKSQLFHPKEGSGRGRVRRQVAGKA